MKSLPGYSFLVSLRDYLAARVDTVTWLTIYIAVLFGVPSRLVLGPLGSAGAPSMLLGLISFAAWVLAKIGAPHIQRGGFDRVTALLFAFLLSVSTTYALAMARPIMPDEVSPSDVAILSLLSWTGTLLMAREIPGHNRREALIWRLSIAGALLALLGIAQFLTRASLVDQISVPGLTSVGEATTFFRDGRVRPVGTSVHPLEYGTILSVLLPFALYSAFFQRSRSVIVRWAPALAIGLAIAISSSRTAYLTGLVAVAVAMIGWSWRQRIAIAALGLVGLGSLGLAAPRLIDSVTNLFSGVRTDPSIESRTDSFVVAWHFIVQHPLFGRGLGTFLGKYRIFDNQFLLLLVSVGIVGTLLFVAVFAAAVIQLWRVMLATRSAQTRALAMCLAGSIIAGGLALAFFDAFAFPMTMGTLFLTLGIATNLALEVRGKGAASRQTSSTGIGLLDFLRASVRQWIVVVTCVALTGAFGLLAIRTTGVQFARMEVVLLAPKTWYDNVLQGGTEGTVMTAGAVAKRVSGAGQDIKYGSLEATLVGISTTGEGTWIRGEDRGGQWASDFRQPIVVVDVVASSPVRVRELQYAAADQIRSALDSLQDELAVDQDQRITLEVAPERSVIHYVHGNRIRALAMTLALGAAVTVLAVWLLDTGRVGPGGHQNRRAKHKVVRP